jgi:hypothetical protein
MAIEDSHVEWQLFVEGDYTLDELLVTLKRAAYGDLNLRPSDPDWGGRGFRFWNDAMVGDVADSHPYETDRSLDFGTFPVIIDFESGYSPGKGAQTMRFADNLFELLRKRGARRLLLVSDLQVELRRFDIGRTP